MDVNAPIEPSRVVSSVAIAPLCAPLCHQNVDVNAPIDGRSPIHYAADYGQLEVLEYLLNKGANINVSTF